VAKVAGAVVELDRPALVVLVVLEEYLAVAVVEVAAWVKAMFLDHLAQVARARRVVL
jgi:hypothetical protein